MRFLGNLLVMICLLSLSVRASPVIFNQEPQGYNKIIYNPDGTIAQIIKADGTILQGASGTICRNGCGKVAEESLREEHDKKKWIIGGLVVAGIAACAVLCRPRECPPDIHTPNPNPGPSPTPTPDQPKPVPEPTTWLLLCAGLGVLGLKRRGA